MQLCALIERLEDICRSSGVKYSDEEFFQLAHDVLFREVHLLLLDVTITVLVLHTWFFFFNFAAGCDNYTNEEEAEENPTAP